MSAEPDPALDIEGFRREGHRLVDWIAEYLAHPERYPVLAATRPGALADALPASAPVAPEPLAAILDDFERLILPGITHWNHPGFLAYFGISGSPPGILGELAAAALNVNAMLWRTSPAATELEQRTLGWLGALLGLPASFFGSLTDTASTSSLVALAAARDAACPEIRARGHEAGGPSLRLYASSEAHSSIDKAAIVLGLGLDNLVRIPVDDAYRMRPDELERRVQADRARGMQPFAVVATLGTTSTTSVDPLPAIAAIAQRERLWLHVDAAYAGSAALVPELAWVLEGAEHADSLVVNPHKWLLTPIDASALFVRDEQQLARAFRHVADYLKTPEQGVVNLMDYGFQLGRRFRALKLWFVLRAHGQQGLVHHIREHVRLAHELAERVDANPDLERLAPTPLSVVCLRARPRDLQGTLEPELEAYLERLNTALLEKLNASGEVFLSHTRLKGRFALRVAIGNQRTSERWVRRAEELLVSGARELDRELRR